ncbi:restriction endonuclease subunit S, partial [Schlesneria sp.]|uniref:restriction endonuclease subunit S n=1 Tax=Schlesneria sp. TaxID=2762018 RepID=UPI002F023FF1
MGKNDDQTKTLTPKLRFPEFNEPWHLATIGDFFISKDVYEKAAAFESDKILTVKLHTNGVVRNERTGTLTGGANYLKRRTGQFIFSKIDLLNGAFGIVPPELDGFYSSSDVPAFSFRENYSASFFISWLTAKYQRLVIERTGTSATLKRVAPEKFKTLPILLPTLPEQRKIAACLTSLDEWIAAEGRKLETLRAHKKGLIQQLFPQEGESRPRLRFPEFRDAEDWEERKAGTLFENRKIKGKEGLPIYSVTIHNGMVRRDSFDRDF